MIVKNVEKKENNMVTFVVEADAKEFEAAVNKAYLKNKKSIAIPGFRKGKAPRVVIEGMYGADVFYDDAFNAIIPDAYSFAAEQESFKIVGMPAINDCKVSEEKTLDIYFECALYPEVVLGQYKGLEVPRDVAEVSDEDVDKELERIRKRNSRLVTVEREAKEGDTANIDFEGFLEGVPFEGGKGENYDLVLGSGSFVPGFEDQVIGMKPGEEKDLDITFPEEYHEGLAGKAVVFKVKLHSVKETELPELDDEFAKDVSEFDTLEEYKKSVKESLLSQRETEVKNEYETKVVEAVIDNMQCEVPEPMIVERQKMMVQNQAESVRQQGFTLAQYLSMFGMDEATFERSTRPSALRQILSEVAMTAVADAEGLECSDEELEKEYETYAEAYEADMETVKKYLQAEDLKEDIRRRKAYNIVVDSAVPTEKKPEEEPAPEAGAEPSESEAEPQEEKKEKEPADE